MIFGRQPAWWLAFVAVVVDLAVAYKVPLNDVQQAGINAAATAVLGFAVAYMVAREKALPLVTGLVGAVGNLAVAFGAPLSQDAMAATGTAITFALAYYWHANVTAPVDPDGNKVESVKLL